MYLLVYSVLLGVPCPVQVVCSSVVVGGWSSSGSRRQLGSGLAYVQLSRHHVGDQPGPVLVHEVDLAAGLLNRGGIRVGSGPYLVDDIILPGRGRYSDGDTQQSF